MRGTLKWWSAKGYGFLARDGGGETFLHVSQLRKSGYDDEPEEGESFDYSIDYTADGRSFAHSLRRTNE